METMHTLFWAYPPRGTTPSIASSSAANTNPSNSNSSGSRKTTVSTESGVGAGFGQHAGSAMGMGIGAGGRAGPVRQASLPAQPQGQGRPGLGLSTISSATSVSGTSTPGAGREPGSSSAITGGPGPGRGMPGRSVTMAPGFTPVNNPHASNAAQNDFNAPSPSSTMYSDDPYSPFPSGSGDYSPYPQYRDRGSEQQQHPSRVRQQTFAGVSALSTTPSTRPEPVGSPARGQTATQAQGQGQGRKDSEDGASTGSATFPPRARAGRRTKTVQELWFGGVTKDETLTEQTDEPEEIDEEDDEEDAKDADNDDEENPHEIVVKDAERELTLPWARSVALVVSSSSGVAIDVQIVRPHTPVPKEEIREIPLVPGLTAGAEQQQQHERRRGVESFGTGPGTGEPRFLFRFRGSYAKVLFAKSALRREITPEAKAEVSFPLTQVYSLSALFPSSSRQTGLSPNTIIPEVRAKLNDIAMKTGVLLTIDDPVVRRHGGSAGSVRERESISSGTPHGMTARRRLGSGSSASATRRPVTTWNGNAGRVEEPQAQQPAPAPAPDTGVVMDSPESMHMELPGIGAQDGAGVIGQKPGSRQGSRQGSLELPPRSATSSRFFPTTATESTPSPASHRFSGILDREQLQEEMLNQTFENMGFIKEGTCVIVVQGLRQAVASAKTLLLVLSDELNGLHVETIEIPEKLHRIVAGRKNGAINHVMSATETNIYIPEGRLVQAEEQASYGSLSPVMSPPLRFSPFLGATSPGLGAGFGAGPVTGIPGLTDPTVPDLASGLSALSMHSQPYANVTNNLTLSPGQLPLTSSPTPTHSGWASPGTISPGMHVAPGINRDVIYITGASAVRVLNAKEWLLRSAFEKNAAVMSFQSPLSPRKLDWMIHERSDTVRKIMFDNGCTIRLLPASRVGLVQVMGDHEVSIRRTMKHVIRLVTDTCLAAAWTIETANVTSRYDTEDQARKLAIETDVEMASGAGCIEAFSGDSGISGARRIFDMIENPTSVGYSTHVQFQVQPLIEHQDFLGGKGMGKIVSMSRKSNAKIQLVPASDRLFTLDIRSESIASVATALGVLQEELPAETSFYLPEAFHRKIIGRNGKNIQEIMYRHNVAVRFSSAEQWAEFGGHQDNEDNVLIITPAKNAAVIERVKDIVMEHVPEETRYYAPRYVTPIPRAYHASIQANPALHQWQDKFGAAIRCLPRERGVDAIEVYSSLAVLPAIEPILRSLVPLERLAVIRTNVHPLDLPDWHICAQNVLDSTAVSVRLSSMFRDDKMVGITFVSGIRDTARFEVAKTILERFFAERQRPEVSANAFSPWGNEAAGANSIVFARAGSEPPVQYENRNFRTTVKNGKTGSLDPSMTMDWMERTGNSSPFESIPEEAAQPKGLAQRLRIATARTQSLDLKTLSGSAGAYLQQQQPQSPYLQTQTQNQTWNQNQQQTSNQMHSHANQPHSGYGGPTSASPTTSVFASDPLSATSAGFYNLPH